MTMERYAIGLDLGTSSVKAVLFSTEKGVVAKDSAAFTYAPAYLPDGSEYLGINMEKFYRTICSVLQNLAKRCLTVRILVVLPWQAPPETVFFAIRTATPLSTRIPGSRPV